MQQALQYAKMMDIPPSPEALWQMYLEKNNVNEVKEKVITQPYYSDNPNKQPRYYQMNAINKTVNAVLNERKSKRIQQLLGHRDVKTTITVYNSVDNEYNEKVKEEQMLIDQNISEEVIEERKEKLVKDMTDEEFDDMLQKLMEERQERRRKKQSDMEM